MHENHEWLSVVNPDRPTHLGGPRLPSLPLWGCRPLEPRLVLDGLLPHTHNKKTGYPKQDLSILLDSHRGFDSLSVVAPGRPKKPRGSSGSYFKIRAGPGRRSSILWI